MTAARAVRELLQRLIDHPLPADSILNVNVPDLPWDQIKGYRSTRLGCRHRAQPIVPTADPKGNRVYWVGPPGKGQDAGPGTDFAAIADGYVSVTPLQIDLTRHAAVAELSDWLEQE